MHEAESSVRDVPKVIIPRNCRLIAPSDIRLRHAKASSRAGGRPRLGFAHVVLAFGFAFQAMGLKMCSFGYKPGIGKWHLSHAREMKKIVPLHDNRIQPSSRTDLEVSRISHCAPNKPDGVDPDRMPDVLT